MARLLPLLLAALFFLAPALSHAGSGRVHSLSLKSGKSLRGEIVGYSKGHYLVKQSGGKTLRVSSSAVRRISPPWTPPQKSSGQTRTGTRSSGGGYRTLSASQQAASSQRQAAARKRDQEIRELRQRLAAIETRARAGDADSMYQLAAAYCDARSPVRSMSTGLSWLQAAARAGHPAAARDLRRYQEQKRQGEQMMAGFAIVGGLALLAAIASEGGGGFAPSSQSDQEAAFQNALVERERALQWRQRNPAGYNPYSGSYSD